MNREKIFNIEAVRLNNIEKEYELNAKLVAVYGFGETGSVKDRIALYMIEKAISQGKIEKGGTFIEATSGNTGIGIAYIARELGYKSKIVMPDTMTRERIELMKKYGAEVVLSDGSKGMDGANALANKLAETTVNSIVLKQFENENNPLAHFDTTAPRIFEAVKSFDAFVCPFGTGGTVSGVGRYIKEKGLETEVVAVEPADSPLISKGYAGAHKIQGIGANFIPKVLDLSVIDKTVTIDFESSVKMLKELFNRENLFVGISSAASVAAAVYYAKVPENSNKTIVLMMFDSGEKYKSTGLYN